MFETEKTSQRRKGIVEATSYLKIIHPLFLLWSSFVQKNNIERCLDYGYTVRKMVNTFSFEQIFNNVLLLMHVIT